MTIPSDCFEEDSYIACSSILIAKRKGVKPDVVPIIFHRPGCCNLQECPSLGNKRAVVAGDESIL